MHVLVHNVDIVKQYLILPKMVCHNNCMYAQAIIKMRNTFVVMDFAFVYRGRKRGQSKRKLYITIFYYCVICTNVVYTSHVPATIFMSICTNLLTGRQFENIVLYNYFWKLKHV